MAKKGLLDLFSLVSQEIDNNINHYQFTITGAYGAGKSTFANTLFNKLGNAIVFGAEDRFKGIRDIRVVPISNWKEAIDYKKMLKKAIKDNNGDNPFDFDTIIIDPVGRLAKMCEDYICEENGWESLADAGFGKGYTLSENEFTDYVNDLKNIGFMIEFIAHGRTDTITPPRAAEGYQKFVPDVPKKLKYITQGEADFVFYLDVLRQVDEDTGINKPVRRLYMQNYADYELKVAIEGLPDYIDYENVDEGVEKFIAAFDKAVEYTKGKNGAKPVHKKHDVQDLPDTQPTQDDPVAGPSHEQLIADAIVIRDELLGKLERDNVIDILTNFLGTPVIADCKDDEKLKKFINH